MTEQDFNEYLRKTLFDEAKTDENFEKVHAIYQKTAKYLQNFPFVKYPYPGYEALEYVCKYFTFNTVLDVGCGEGYQSTAFLEKGKKVTGIDYGKTYRIAYCEEKDDFNLIIDDFNTYEFKEKYDLVWCCHVLEHQLNVQSFLTKLLSVVDEGGIIAITVPPYKSEIVGGHVNLYNAGMLLYRLILAGCDCREASVKKYGYNISVVVKKRSINPLEEICYDTGDIKTLKRYFPDEIAFYDGNLMRDLYFEGNLAEINWKR